MLQGLATSLAVPQNPTVRRVSSLWLSGSKLVRRTKDLLLLAQAPKAGLGVQVGTAD